jgi:hypothetical protein
MLEARTGTLPHSMQNTQKKKHSEGQGRVFFQKGKEMLKHSLALVGLGRAVSHCETPVEADAAGSVTALRAMR